ncbi:MAG TPA: nucleotidyltransferase domain-containing protein [Candidatus Hydrogenedentes bacterium]|nr:nucleotidyltransferase domain-containing protein [Candidatus Hydrogenedentota bacterium]
MSKVSDGIVERVKKIVHATQPTAKIVLFGSHARGDADNDSDWDFLILLDESSAAIKNRVLDDLFELTLETGEAVVPLFRTQDEWEHGNVRITQFYDEVSKEGIAV